MAICGPTGSKSGPTSTAGTPGMRWISASERLPNTTRLSATETTTTTHRRSPRVIWRNRSIRRRGGRLRADVCRGKPEVKMLLLILTVLASSLACQALPIQNAAAQSKMTESRVTREDDSGARYRYLFENDRFTTPRMEVEFDAKGKGHFRFTRKGEP